MQPTILACAAPDCILYLCQRDTCYRMIDIVVRILQAEGLDNRLLQVMLLNCAGSKVVDLTVPALGRGGTIDEGEVFVA